MAHPTLTQLSVLTLPCSYCSYHGLDGIIRHPHPILITHKNMPKKSQQARDHLYNLMNTTSVAEI